MLDERKRFFSWESRDGHTIKTESLKEIHVPMSKSQNYDTLRLGPLGHSDDLSEQVLKGEV